MNSDKVRGQGNGSSEGLCAFIFSFVLENFLVEVYKDEIILAPHPKTARKVTTKAERKPRQGCQQQKNNVIWN